jgi:hypothetical protein
MHRTMDGWRPQQCSRSVINDAERARERASELTIDRYGGGGGVNVRGLPANGCSRRVVVGARVLRQQCCGCSFIMPRAAEPSLLTCISNHKGS